MKKILIAALALTVAAGAVSAQNMGWEWVDKSSKADNILPGVKVPMVTGDVITAGSSTVYPLSEAIVDQLKKEGYKGNITIDSIGSGAGFERFTKTGETDVSNASQKIKQSEIDQGRAIGRDPIEIRVGTDALSVVVSNKNTFATDVTLAELNKIFSTAVLWSDVRPNWPKQKIQRFIPGTDSGTFSYFVEHIFKKDKAPILAAANTQKSEDDNILVRGIEGSPYAIGFFGYAYYEENKKQLKALKINGVAPGLESVNANTYPLSRPLFLYTSANILKDKPQVAAYIVYYLTNVNRVIKKVGYFAAPQADLDKTKMMVLDTIKGSF